MTDLKQLASLIRVKNVVDSEITRITDRPALTGHTGEYIVSEIFSIQLHPSAAKSESDGVFMDGALAGKSVNVKWYLKQESILDIKIGYLCDYYLVLAGPSGSAVSSRGLVRPWIISSVHLFDIPSLLSTLRERKVKIGGGTSMRKADYEAAEIYPSQRNPLLTLTQVQRDMLALFSIV